MPPNPNKIPITALREGLDCLPKRPIMINHKGKMEPIIAPRPAEMYFTPIVVRPFERKKFKKLNTIIGPHSIPLGKARPLLIKNIT